MPNNQRFGRIDRGQEHERALIMRLHAKREDIPDQGHSIAATQPLARVVDTILKRAQRASA